MGCPLSEAMAKSRRPMNEYMVACAWCDRYIDGNPEADLISHGICQECADKMEEKR